MGDQKNKIQSSEELNNQKDQDTQVKGGQAFREEGYQGREDSKGQNDQSSDSQEFGQDQDIKMGDSSNLNDGSRNLENQNEE